MILELVYEIVDELKGAIENAQNESSRNDLDIPGGHLSPLTRDRDRPHERVLISSHPHVSLAYCPGFG